MSDEVNEPRRRGEVTALLLAWSGGKKSALDQLIPMMYPELRRLAHRCMRDEHGGHTLNTSALINEAYLRLVESAQVNWRDRAHFLALSARLMRRILVDSARSRQSKKRGSGDRPVPLETALDLHRMPNRELVRLDDALNELATVYPRKAKVVEMRFFGGLSMEDSAQALGVSPDTVMRDWRLARVWLYRAMSSGGSDDR